VSPQVADLREITVQSQGFQGGINMRDAIDQLAPNDLVRCENVVYDAAGGLAKRTGTRSMGTFGVGADRVLSTYTFYRGASNPQVLIHTSAGKMYYTTDVTANPITWTQITTGLSTTVPASFETMLSKCYFAEGTVLGQWDGAAYSTIAGAPAGITFLRVWKDTMWAAGSSNVDRLYSSSAGDPTTWPGANFVDIMKGDGDKITCLASDGLFLVVFKQRRTQVVYDPALFSNRTADFEKGCESHFSVVHMEDKMYYMSRLGFCWWQGDSSARLISYKIDPLFTPGVLNLSALNLVYAYQLNDRCGWAIPEAGSSVPSLIVEYYPRLGQVYQISGNIGPGPWSFHRMPVQNFTTVRQGTSEALYGGHPSTNKFMWVFSPDGTDDGATFNSKVETAALNFGQPVMWKYFRRMTLVGRGKFNLQVKRNYRTDILVNKTVDMNAGSATWNNGNWNNGAWGPDSVVKRKLINQDIYCVALSVVITDSEVNVASVPFPVGSKDASLTQGEWALFQVAFDGFLLGIRE
jgi:hypothetical protein